MIKLNLGCGHVQPQGWVNVDGSNRAWLASHLPALDQFLVRFGILPATEFNRETRFANLLQRFPWADQSVDVIYMGEMLEHFTHAEGDWVLRECFRVLKAGGVMRLRVPDHVRFWKNYVEEFAQTRQLARGQWTLGHTRWTEMYFRDICVARAKPWQSMGHFHKWMYDEVSLILTMEAVGFTNVERMPFHQSRIAAIETVEARDDLIVEGIRP